MDKETLSNYGWIVIAVLVLAVMIALATPFGEFISQAVQSTTKGLFSASQNALNSAGVPGLTIEDQEFDVPGQTAKSTIEIPHEPGAKYKDGTFRGWAEFEGQAVDDWYIYDFQMMCDETLVSFVCKEGVWQIGFNSFQEDTALEIIVFPNSLIEVLDGAFMYCTSLRNIIFNGTIAEWNAITFGQDWNYYCPEITVTCTDGTIIIPANN